MKKIMFALVALLTMSVSASAMSYEQARNEALFLTDKMAYELNLTDAQYEAAYEINLDYLMGVTSVDDVYGPYWERRNLDLSYILYNWQWDAFIAASYFYRPLYWSAGYWHFGIYARYPHRDYFFYGRPHFYATYRGGHSWHLNGGRSYYHGRADHFRPALPAGRQHFGMRDGFNRGDFRNVRPGSSTRVTTGHSRMGRNDRYAPETRGNNRSYDNNRSGNRNDRGTFNGNRSYDNSRNGSGRFSGNRSSSDLPNRPSSGVNTTPTRPSTPSSGVNTTPSRPSTGVTTTPSRPSSNSFSGNRPSTSSAPTRTFGGSSSSSSNRSFGNSSSSSSNRTFGGSSSSTPSRSYSASSSSSRPSSGSFSGGRSFGSSRSNGSSTRSVGGSSSSRSSGGGSRGGGHFGGGRR